MKKTQIVLAVFLFIALSSCNTSEKIASEAGKKELTTAQTRKEDKKNTKTIDMDTPIHLVESYGSVCCPKDPKHDRHIGKYISNFEKKYQVKITTYYVVQGREGEATYFVNLDGVHQKLQLMFLMDRMGTEDYKVAEAKLKNAIPLKKLAPQGRPIKKM